MVNTVVSVLSLFLSTSMVNAVVSVFIAVILSASMANAVVSVVIAAFYLPACVMLWSVLLSLFFNLPAWLTLWSALLSLLCVCTSMYNSDVCMYGMSQLRSCCGVYGSSLVSMLFIATSTCKAVVRMGQCWYRCGGIFQHWYGCSWCVCPHRCRCFFIQSIYNPALRVLCSKLGGQYILIRLFCYPVVTCYSLVVCVQHAARSRKGGYAPNNENCQSFGPCGASTQQTYSAGCRSVWLSFSTNVQRRLQERLTLLLNKRTASAAGASDSPSQQRRVVQTPRSVSEEVCPDTIARVTAEELIRQLRQTATVHSSSSTSTACTDVPPSCLPVELTTTASSSSGPMSGIDVTVVGQPPPCTPGPSQSEATWGGSVMHTVSNMLRGESIEQSGPPSIHLHSTPLGTHLSDRLKDKIWANEYVDFADLLYQHPIHPLSLSISPGNDKATFSIAHVGKGRQLQSVEQWTTALITFAATYAQRYPQLAMGLFQYCEILEISLTLAHQWGGACTMNNFVCSDSLPLGISHGTSPGGTFISSKTMYAKPAQNNSSHPFSSTVQQAKCTSFPTGHCWPFQRGTCQTQQCRFKHTCAKCENAHPANQCQKPGPVTLS